MKNLIGLTMAFFLLTIVFSACDKNAELLTQKVAIDGTYDHIQNGVWLLLTFDDTSDSFVGTVENTTTEPIENIRLKIQLSTDGTINVTAPMNLAAGEMKAVSISAKGKVFEEWTPHVGKG